jgi:large conductance mechanosensitive channel
MKKLFKDFKDFISKGNMIDLAVGLIIGSAFSSVINSIVNNLLMPLLSLLFGNVNFSNLYIILKGKDLVSKGATLEMAKEAGALTFNYGQFITDIISFVLLGLGVFLIVKAVQKLKRKEETEEMPAGKTCPYCQSSIPLDATRCPFCTSHLES